MSLSLILESIRPEAQRGLRGILLEALKLGAALCLASAAALSAEPEPQLPEPALPSPEYFVAEPAPNDNGTHIGLRWPRAETDNGDFEYVISVARGPDRSWFECARVAPSGALVTDPEIASFYPYRFSAGPEHHFIVAPTECMSIYWLATERRYAGWLKMANGNLNDCEQQLIGLDRDVTELRRLRLRLKYYEPRWETQLREEKKRYIQEFGLSVSPDDMDVLQAWDGLTAARQKLLDGTSEANAREQLAELDGKLSALSGARKWALRIEESDAGLARLSKSIASTRQICLRKAAEFGGIYALVEAESRIHLAAALGVEADKVTPELVSAKITWLNEKRAEALKALAPSDGDAIDHDAYDRLNYACCLAEAYVEQAQKLISLAAIENDLLWQLSRPLSEAQLEEEQVQQAEAPDAALLANRLADSWRAGAQIDDPQLSKQTLEDWRTAEAAVAEKGEQWEHWVSAKEVELEARLREGQLSEPERPYGHRERTRLTVLVTVADKRLRKIAREHESRRYHFRLAVARKGEEPAEGPWNTSAAAPVPALFDFAKLVNLAFAAFFACAVVGMIIYVHRKPNVFVRRIPGLEAVDEAIGRATEMGKPALFVHGLTDVDSLSVLASLSILGRMARRIADYDSDLLVVNNFPIVYSISYEVVQEGYQEAGRPDAFKPDNIFMAASEQFPYVAAVTGIMKRRMPAANFFMGYFYAEALILAEVGASTGAIQIAATDSFIQIPFFITTCDYTLMGEELYAAGAYLSRNVKSLATLKAQDLSKAVLLASLPLGLAMSNLGINWLSVLFSAYEKGF